MTGAIAISGIFLVCVGTVFACMVAWEDRFPFVGLMLVAAGAVLLLNSCSPPRVVSEAENPCLTHARTVHRGVPCPDTPAVVPDSFRVYVDSASYDFPVTRVLYCGPPNEYRDSVPDACR